MFFDSPIYFLSLGLNYYHGRLIPHRACDKLRLPRHLSGQPNRLRFYISSPALLSHCHSCRHYTEPCSCRRSGRSWGGYRRACRLSYRDRPALRKEEDIKKEERKQILKNRQEMVCKEEGSGYNIYLFHYTASG